MNAKLVQAISNGDRLNAKRLAEENEKTIQFRLNNHILKDDWIYKMISEAIGSGRKDLELYDQRWIDDEENAGWTASAINRVEGLNAIVESQQLGPFTNKKDYYIRVTWDANCM